MHSDAILAAIEEVSGLIGRLDARLSASPLEEAWQIRACFLAAETLSAVDGRPTRLADVLGAMSGTPLPSPANYLPALTGFGHWRRCMAQVELSDLASRLVGRTLTTSAQAAEQQADWDLQDSLPAPARKSMETGTAGEVDRYAYQVGQRALRLMRSEEITGSKLWGVALGMQVAIRADPDPDYFVRAHEMRQQVKTQAERRAESMKSALPSPASTEDAARIEQQVEEFVDSMQWEKPSHLGSCFGVLADRLQDIGLTVNRLSCLTGATKRMGFEGRLDERAFAGFLRQLALDARAGLALLDSLEQTMAQFAGSPDAKFDARSQLPEIIYAFLLYPAVDTVWLETALDLHGRVVRKFVKRLADAGLIAHWADRISRDDQNRREVRLWTAARFENEFSLAMKRAPATVRRATRFGLTPAEMIDRHSDVDIKVPMSTVFEQFENEMLDLDREFSRLLDPRLGKKLAREKAF